MLTVLIRYRKSGREVLIPAKSVEYVPNGDEQGLLINHGCEAEGGCQLGPTAKDDENWRDVFVMNDHGSTVARYSL